MANVARELAIIIAGKDAGATGALKATKTEIEGVQNAAKAPGLSKMDADFRKLRESLVDPVKLKAIQTEMTRISAEAAKGPDAVKMKQLRAEVDKLETSYKQVAAGMDTAGNQGKKSGDYMHGGMMKASTGALSLQSAMSGLGQSGLAMQLGMFGAAAATAFLTAEMVKGAFTAGVDFETAFAGVRKTVDATDEELAQFSAGIRKMATEIPASREEIAKVAEAAGQLGIKKEALLSFTRTMIDLGVATNMSSDQAAESLARLANITRMPQENFDRLGSTVVALGNTMAATEAEIVSMAMRLAGAGDQIGLSEDQILAFAAALSSVGIEAEMGGSAFSRVMIDMANAVQKGGTDLEKFADVAGISVEDFAAAFKVDAAGALVTFLEGLGKVKHEGGNVFGVLEDLGLGEIRVRDTVLRASSAHELFSEALKTGSKAWAENTALTKEAEQRYATTASKIEVMKNKFSELGVELFERTKPAIHGVLDALAGIPDAFKKAGEQAGSFDHIMVAAIPGLRAAHDGWEKYLRDLEAFHATGPVSARRIQELSREGKTFAEAYAIARAEADAFAASVLKMGSNAEGALPAMRALSDEILRQQGIELAPKPPSRYGPEAVEKLDAFTAAVKNSYLWQQDAAETYNDYNQRAYKNQQDAAKKTADEAVRESKRAGDEAVREAERIAEKARDTIWDIGALGKKMLKEVGDALSKETDLWEAYGNRWIEKWGDVDAAIRKTYEDRQAALAGIAESEAITQDRDARKKELADRINGEKKVFDLQQNDVEFHHREELAKEKALRDYQKVLNSSASQEEKNNAWEVYQERLADLVQEHQAFDAEVQWRLAQEKIRADQEAVWATAQAALEKTLHEEELTRQRKAIDAKQQAEEARINAEWAEWQVVEKEKTTKAAEEAKARARANLEAWRDEFIDKLEKEGAPGIERFMGMVAGKWADALASMGAAAASASSSSSEEPVSAAPSGGTTSPITVISSGPATSTTTPAEGWVPSFAAGGIVPGPIGAPVLAVVHGRETVVPAGATIDYNRLAAAIVQALAGVQLAVGVDDVHAALLRKLQSTGSLGW